MKKEMVKLNRIKIAHSKEEAQRLISEGYTPAVSEPTVTSGDGSGRKAEPPQGQSVTADDGQKMDPPQGQSVTADDGQKMDPPQGQDKNSQASDDSGEKEKKGAGKK
ncbi:MAG: hypothetical protein K1W20_12795 [Lachnospiraceae bacterium]